MSRKPRLIEEVVILREYLGLSWWQIAKMFCKNCKREEIGKRALSLYGQYVKYKERRNKQETGKEYEIAENMQADEIEFESVNFKRLQETSIMLIPGSYRELK